MKTISKLVGIIIFLTVIYIGVSAVLHRDTNDRIISQEAALSLQIKADRAALRTAFISDMYNGIRVVSLPIALFFGALGVSVVGIVAGYTNRVQINNKRLSYEPYKNGRMPIVEQPSGLILDTATNVFLDPEHRNSNGNQYTPQLINGLNTASNLASIAQHSSGKANAAMTKGAVGHYSIAPPRHQSYLPQTDSLQIEQHDDEPTVLIQDINEMIGMSSPTRWVMGQGLNGELCEFEFSSDPHLLIMGKTGSGKTQLSMMVMIYCNLYKYHLTVLDGKGGADYGRFGDAGLIDWHKLDGSNLLPFLQAIWQEYEYRERLITDARCSDIDEYNASHQPLKRRFIMFEEFSGALRELKKLIKNKILSKSEFDLILLTLADLICKCRFTGITLVIIDQVPIKSLYQQDVLAQLKSLVFKLEGKGYSIMEVSNVCQTLDAGHFIDHRGTIYRAWFTKKHFDFSRLRVQKNKGVTLLEPVKRKSDRVANGPENNRLLGGYDGYDGYEQQNNHHDNRMITAAAAPEEQREAPHIDPYKLSEDAAEYIMDTRANVSSWNEFWSNKMIGLSKGPKSQSIMKQLREMGYTE